MNTKIGGVTPGRVVHYVLDKAPGESNHRAAIITEVFSNDGTVNLTVFVDGVNDAVSDDDREPITLRRYFVLHDMVEMLPGTWHWIEKV